MPKGVYPRVEWTDNDLKCLAKLWSTHITPEVARILRRSIASVQARAFRLRLKKQWHVRPDEYSPEEDEKIKALYRLLPSKQLSEQLGRSPKAIIARAIRLGVSSVRSFIAGRGRTLKDIEAAYIAGLLDGEGTIRIHTHNSKTSPKPLLLPSVQIVNISYDALQFVKTATALGSIKKGRSCYVWAIGAFYDIKPLLIQLLPYLIIKKQLAQLIIEWIDLRLAQHRNRRNASEYIGYTTRQKEILSDMKSINKPGKWRRLNGNPVSDAPI